MYKKDSNFWGDFFIILILPFNKTGEANTACVKMEGNSIGPKAGYFGLMFSDNGS
jgi:hypothetical protein